MVGLPARGKSYISKAIMRYLSFLGVRCKLFNAGNKRRDQGKAGADAKFFDPDNKDAQALKEQMAMETLEDMFEWLNGETVYSPSSACSVGLRCGIFDATNTTTTRRRAVIERCAQQSPAVTLIFLETVCNDETILQQNYQMKLINDDYKGADVQKALGDFIERVHAYEKVYEQITDAEVAAIASASGSKADDAPLPPLRYIQSIDAGKKVVVSQLEGDSFICKWTMQLMHAIHLAPRKLSIVLAGESCNDRDSIRGGDTTLSEEGFKYARAAVDIVRSRLALPPHLVSSCTPPIALTGSLIRYSQMGELLCEHCEYVLPMLALNEMCFGALESLQGGRLRDWFPREYAAREADKLNYRYPGVGGQSYYDMITQLHEVLLMIESSRRDIIVVCDVATARVLLGYFEGTPLEQIPDLVVSPGVIELTRSHSGFTRTNVPVEEGRTSMLGGLAAVEFLGNMKAGTESSPKQKVATPTTKLAP